MFKVVLIVVTVGVGFDARGIHGPRWDCGSSAAWETPGTRGGRRAIAATAGADIARANGAGANSARATTQDATYSQDHSS